MKNKILWVLTIFPFLITLFAIQFMPDSVPMHYDIYGNIDRWGIKYELFILPSIILLLTMMWKVWISSYNKKNEKIGDMTSDIIIHFFESFASSAKLNIYGTAEGANDHHKAEAVFKAFAKSLKEAIKIEHDQIPSTKGVL